MAYYPGQQVKHRSPRRITLPKILLALLLLSGVYFGIAFFPPYWAYYRADTIMAEHTREMWSRRRQDDDLVDMRMKIRNRVVKELLGVLKIPRRDLFVEVTMKDGDRYVQVEARWTAYAVWPLVGKRSRLRFSKRIEMKTR